jgi:hypothetical protein
VEQLFNQLMRPKLRTLIVDVYRDVTYALDDDGYTATEYQDVVRKRFVKAWEGLIDGYKVCACDVGLDSAQRTKPPLGHLH